MEYDLPIGFYVVMGIVIGLLFNIATDRRN